MQNPAIYIYHFIQRNLRINEPDLIYTWNSHKTLPPVNPALHNRARRTHRSFRATVQRIAALGPMMDPREKRILIRILRFMQSPREALRGIRFRNSEMLQAIVERCSVEVLYYEQLINPALAAANAVQQQEEIVEINLEEDAQQNGEWEVFERLLRISN